MERLEDGPAGTCFLRAVCSSDRAGAGLYSSPPQPARSRQRALAMGRDILLYCRAGRTLLSRLGAELIRAARRPPGGFGDRVGIVRAVALQQTVSPLQLALRVAGDHRWNLLRACVARASAGSGLDDHSCQRGLALGNMVLGMLPGAYLKSGTAG